MAREKILIVEDDEDIGEMITYNLDKEGYKTLTVRDGRDAVKVVNKEKPQMIILDIMLPGIDGLEICRILRQNESTKTIPIIMLTAKSEETDKVVGLELGADDYMTKPFSPRELLARLKAVLRRVSAPTPSGIFSSGEIEIDTLKYTVTVSGVPVILTTTEFKLLEFMAQRKGIVLSRSTILDEVLGYGSETYDRTVDTHIKSLRKKLGKARTYIETVRGVGYRFKESRDG